MTLQLLHITSVKCLSSYPHNYYKLRVHKLVFIFVLAKTEEK